MIPEVLSLSPPHTPPPLPSDPRHSRSLAHSREVSVSVANGPLFISSPFDSLCKPTAPPLFRLLPQSFRLSLYYLTSSRLRARIHSSCTQSIVDIQKQWSSVLYTGTGNGLVDSPTTPPNVSFDHSTSPTSNLDGTRHTHIAPPSMIVRAIPSQDTAHLHKPSFLDKG
jgi:hypothetical protein